MSATPRTDALLVTPEGEQIIVHGPTLEGLVELCRELECSFSDSQRGEGDECPVCDGGRLAVRRYLECQKCEAHLCQPGEKEPPPPEPIEDCIKHYEAECCTFDDPVKCADVALLYASRMPSSHVRALLYTLANAAKARGALVEEKDKEIAALKHQIDLMNQQGHYLGSKAQ